METLAIQAMDLSRDYGKTRAVDHVNFGVRQGEVFGFLGANGAGKTTTVRMLTTLLEPTSGTAMLNGYDVTRQSYQARHQFGVVPEDSNVYRELTARDNLMFSGKLYRVTTAEREKRASELLSRFELTDREDSIVETFSRGMRRKLTIAMALMHRPSILFLDEPTAGLDVLGQRSILEFVRQLSAEGMTIFLTTHQLEEANQLCDRVAIIDHGRIAAVGTPERLKQAFKRLQSVEVAFDPTPEAIKAQSAGLPGVGSVVKLGDKFRVYTLEPAQLLPAITDFAAQRSLRLIALNTLGPSLEDVFLLITGRRRTGDGDEPGDEEFCARGGGHGGMSCRGRRDGSCRKGREG